MPKMCEIDSNMDDHMVIRHGYVFNDDSLVAKAANFDFKTQVMNLK